jgi:hypothetical protein
LWVGKKLNYYETGGPLNYSRLISISDARPWATSSLLLGSQGFWLPQDYMRRRMNSVAAGMRGTKAGFLIFQLPEIFDA